MKMIQFVNIRMIQTSLALIFLIQVVHRRSCVVEVLVVEHFLQHIITFLLDFGPRFFHCSKGCSLAADSHTSILDILLN